LPARLLTRPPPSGLWRWSIEPPSASRCAGANQSVRWAGRRLWPGFRSRSTQPSDRLQVAERHNHWARQEEAVGHTGSPSTGSCRPARVHCISASGTVSPAQEPRLPTMAGRVRCGRSAPGALRVEPHGFRMANLLHSPALKITPAPGNMRRLIKRTYPGTPGSNRASEVINACDRPIQATDGAGLSGVASTV
jgi:hypothetical protein